MERKDIWILGLSETHWTDSGYSTTDRGNKIYFSGPKDEHSKGVAFIIPIIMDMFMFAPTEQSTVEEIENFYYALTSAPKDIPKREITTVLGDFNAKSDITDPEYAWNDLQKLIVQAAKDLPKPNMKNYITTETANVIIRRRELKRRGITLAQDIKAYGQLSS
ncbi:endonuclease-reverse transcriptase [Danaus plexippus plexippus]|uniref:Endonuclease-reverse transcriptase n=1 Tax=Danaus plexippus plexippus TaxID=278856 RepID=A0A212F657_DANPL|nr:endonuclease-reverse transcriptase [Danaus plexippus plexippus]